MKNYKHKNNNIISMRKTIKFLAIIALFIGFTSCNKDDDPVPGNDTIEFEGTFSREFVVQDNTERATYTISQDKINYDLSGGFAQTNYDIKKEYFSKKEVESVEAGKNEPVPAADNTENHGWNVFKKDLPISGKVENLHAPQSADYTTNPPTISGKFTKFDFATGKVTDSDTDWDIAFRGTKIIVNGGVSSGLTDEPERNGDAAGYIAKGTLESVTSVDTSLLVQDSADGFAISNEWYSYDSTTHIITALAGKIIVIRTRDGKYAKVEILSYYKDGDTNSDYRYYTFNYVYQPKDGVTTF